MEEANVQHSAARRIVNLLETAAEFLASAFEYSTVVGEKYRRARFGRIGDLLYFFRLVDTDVARETHYNINFWTDAEVLAWKSSYISTCNAISVAGAIFASLGLTALQLPDLNSTHWTARACFISSMVLGILSVMTATSQQQAVGMVNDPLSIRLWLSRGQPEPEKHEDNQPFNILPLESSISAIKKSSLPRHLLQLAVVIFLVGFGLYLLYSWLEQITDKPTDYRDLLFAFLVTVGTFVVYQSFWTVVNINDDRKRATDFDLRSRGYYEQPYYLEKLKRDLQRVQNLAAEMEREQMEKYALAHGVTVEELLSNMKEQVALTTERASVTGIPPSDDSSQISKPG